MKKMLIAVMSMALALFAASCVPKTELSVGQSALTFDNKGGSQSVSFTANKVWSATSSQSWCKVTPTSGDGSANSSQSFTVSCDPNTTYDPRTCDIKIVCEELTAMISVTQAEGAGLLVSQTDFSLTNEAQTVSIEVKSNVDYLVSVEGDATSWIKVQSTKGLDTHTIVLAISENKDYDSRTGKVTVKDVSGSLSQTITIKQGEAYGLFLTKPEYNLSNESHSLTVEVKANVSFDVVPQVDWIKYVETKGLKTSQIVLDIAANDSYDAREGKVLVRQTGGTLSETLTIRQDEAFGLIITKTGYGLSSEEQTIDVEVKTNVELEVVIPDDAKSWIVPMGTKGLTTSHYTFLVKENESTVGRGGSITFKQKDGTLSDTVYIKQEGAEPFLEVSPTELKVSSEAQTCAVTVKANLEYEIDLDAQDWIKAEPSPAAPGKVILHIAENPGGMREGLVVINASDLRAAVKVIQTGGVIVFADPKVKEICVKNWDTDGDGEISYDEAKAVRLVGEVFRGNKEITSFNELRYFTGLVNITNFAFEACDNLAMVAIPEGVRRIGMYAFSECSKLASVTLPSTLEEMAIWAFYSCVSLKSIDLPESLTVIPEGAFSGCESLSSIKLPDGVVRIGKSAFRNCNSLITLKIPDGVGIIDDRAFGSCKLLKVMEIPGSVDTIGKSAFERCENLVDVWLNEGVKVIDRMAFDRCSSLASIKLPKSIVFLGDDAFRYCENLKAANVPVAVYGTSVFSKCTSLTDVSFAEDVKEIGAFMFDGCTGLPSIVLPKGLTTFGKAAFQHCESLAAIEIPDTVTEIGEGVFNQCISLKKVALPGGLEALGDAAFANCTALPGLELPKHLTFIGKNCFSACESLASIDIPESVKTIGEKAFIGCNALKSIVLPPTLSEIKAETFFHCIELAEINIPGSVSSIGDRAFEQCGKLKSATLPEGLTYLGVRAFYDCSGLSSVKVLAVTPPAGSPSMFAGSTCPIYVPASSEKDYKTALYWKDYASRIVVLP